MPDQACFLSKAFLIRYCEEEVEINDVAVFRAEVDVEPGYLDTEFFLETDLFFSDLSNIGGPEKWQQHVDEFEEQAIFKKVSTQVFSIKGLAHGVFEFLPVNFQEQYFSVLKTSVWSVLLDFRFRLKQLNIQASAPTARSARELASA